MPAPPAFGLDWHVGHDIRITIGWQALAFSLGPMLSNQELGQILSKIQLMAHLPVTILGDLLMVWLLAHEDKSIRDAQINQEPKEVVPPLFGMPIRWIFGSQLIGVVYTIHVLIVFWYDYWTMDILTWPIMGFALHNCVCCDRIICSGDQVDYPFVFPGHSHEGTLLGPFRLSLFFDTFRMKRILWKLFSVQPHLASGKNTIIQ